MKSLFYHKITIESPSYSCIRNKFRLLVLNVVRIPIDDQSNHASPSRNYPRNLNHHSNSKIHLVLKMCKH
jgi:DNA-binding transcriptional MocR family regulator